MTPPSATLTHLPTSHDQDVRISLLEMEHSRTREDIGELRDGIEKLSTRLDARLECIQTKLTELRKAVDESVPPWAARELASARAMRSVAITITGLAITVALAVLGLWLH